MRYLNNRKLNAAFIISGCFMLAIILSTVISCSGPDTHDTSERMAKMAMSTASMWMMEKHKHEIEEGLEKGDWEEALEEAEELVPWIVGTPWLHELMPHAKKTTESVKMVVEKLIAKDKEGAEAALKEMDMQFHHIHHELMEIVGEGKHAGGNHH